MLKLDGTENKKKLGANAILAVSLAVSKAEAISSKKELDCIFVGKIFHSLTKNSFKNKQGLVKHIQKNNIHKKTILLKGSRGIGLEQLIKNL